MDIKNSYLTERRVLGLLGMFLAPLDLLLGFLFGMENPAMWYSSISATYWANSSTLFVGLMFAVTVFLLCYRGYDKWDRIINAISAVSGLLLTCCPCNLSSITVERAGLFQLPLGLSGVVHGICAAIFFLSLAANIYINFRKGSSTKRKILRNVIYTICASVIAVSTLGIALFSILKVWATSTVTFEAIALFAFGVAWLVKGEAIRKLND